MPVSHIILLTDFGTKDPFCGILHGIIKSIAPEASILDLTHGIEPRNIQEAAFVLEDSFAYFPPQSLFVCVVDPGVGSNRAILWAECSGYTFLAPDNGLLSYVLQDRSNYKLRKVTNAGLYHSRGVSKTFHGRDIFAPVAARLAQGLDPEKIGPEIRNFVSLKLPKRRNSENLAETVVIGIDHFGNLLTNYRFEGKQKADRVRAVEICGQIIAFSSGTYADHSGQLFAHCNSFNRLEISEGSGSARARLGAKPGTHVRIEYEEKQI